MRKMNILGVSLWDCTLKEALGRAESFIGSGALNTILYLTVPFLVAAGQDEHRKRWIESMDMVICGEQDILTVAGITSRSRLHETENYLFLKELLRRLIRSGRTVYLLGDTESGADSLLGEMRDQQDGFVLAGIGYYTDSDPEALINEINAVTPSVIISRLPADKQEEFVSVCRRLGNAGLWIGMPEDLHMGMDRESLYIRAMRKFYKCIFRRIVHRYYK